ncbi:hypothetical protein F4780DRAFT_456933 [Xylariomycetidae sp. FL0641]|nr:hypothetical protein F4780DRAFT_456933 [Xylariomycetidae sp. FL0641]
MSTTTTSAASATTSAVCGPQMYDIPVTEAACAVPFGGNHTDVMGNCCKSADVLSYASDCGLYCLGIEQTLADLRDCLYDGGLAYQDVFCNQVNLTTASATATDATPASTASATVVVTNSSGGDNDNDDDNDGGDGDDSADGDGDDSKTTHTPNAAPSVRSEFTISTIGLTIGALLFSATTFGAFQL